MDPTNDGLLTTVNQANQLYKNVFGTHEATLDAKLLVMSADLGMQKAKQLRMGQGGFDETEYISRLITKMGGHDVDNDQLDMDWSKIGRLAMKFTRRVPTMDFMLGPMSVEHKSRVFTQRARIVRDPKAMRKPQELKEEDITRQENETTKNVMQVFHILEQCSEKVNLFELVVNPESFGQTVENIFYLSFLVRDGKVSISEEDVDDPNRGQDDDSDDEPREPREGANIQPMVELTEPPTAEDYQSGLLKKQMVMELDMETWRPPPGGYQQQQPYNQYAPQQQVQGGYGGYQQAAPQAPPQTPEANLRYWFDAVDTDHSGRLSTEELQRALVNGDWSPFNIETVRLMMNMFDQDNSGLISFNEFAGLWKYIEEWRACFQAFDKDKSGYIDFNELKTAMQTFRYNLSDNFLRLIIKKYDKRGKNPEGRGDVSFDNFVQIAVTVKSLTDAFQRIDREGKGYATIGYEQFLELVVSNR
ncbi:nuclear protein [Haplosporangium sp. Z 11]|nr:nuclear protein [Haplosporangium sp. Z 11]